MRIAARFTDFAMKQLIFECEEDIEKNTGERHDVIGRKIEEVFYNKQKMNGFFNNLPDNMKNVDDNCLEFAFPVNVQSGGQYNLKMETLNT